MRTLALLAPLALAALAAPRQEEPAASAPPPRFEAYDVFVDPGSTPLAAWQVALADVTGRARLVGIEGGDGAFAEPPSYDPRALSGGRVVLAAFSLEDELPAGRVRVARLHVALDGAEEPHFELHLEAAADRAGEPLAATVEIAR